MKTTKTMGLILLMTFISSTVFGNTTETEMSVRSERKIGAYLSLLGEPHPTLLGVNVGYNFLDYLRASLGYGEVSVGMGDVEASMSSLGVLGKASVPGWSFSPTLALGYTRVFTSSNLETNLGENNIYTQLGLDWQSKTGFNLGLGVNVSLNGAAPAAPFLNLGWFFDYI